MDQQQHDGQLKQSGGGLWAAGIFFVALVFLLILLGGYVQGWEWTGLTPPKQRTFWDWLDLLVVPAVLAVGGYLFTLSENRKTQQVADQRAQDEALQAYLDKISELLIDEGLHKRDDPYDPTRVTARARTLAILRKLDGKRKRTVLLFLRESRLINSKARCRRGRLAAHARLVGLADADLKNADLRGARLISTDHLEAVSLEGADLEKADLRRAQLSRANLSRATLTHADLSHTNLGDALLQHVDLGYAKLHNAHLRGVNLNRANLQDADLFKADLSHANLSHTDLSRIKLRRANLKSATLSNATLIRADLSGADLSGAFLRETILSGAMLRDGVILSRTDLSGADLSGADLSGAEGISEEELENQVQSLDGATMPNGQKYEDWLKSKSSGEDGGNDGPS